MSWLFKVASAAAVVVALGALAPAASHAQAVTDGASGPCIASTAPSTAMPFAI